MLKLLTKYNVAAPRYTSYPTVPYWDLDKFDAQIYLNRLKVNYAQVKSSGISLYIHLPFCESLCTYCGCNTRITKNHQVESPYIEALIKEWGLYTQLLGEVPKIKELHLGGGTPTFFSPANLHRLLSTILAGQTEKGDYSFEAHPDNTTPEHLEVLYQLGFTRISLGIQDFDPKVQFLINRFQTVEQVQTISAQARKIGYESINYDLIYGLPGQNLAGLKSTMESVIQLHPDRIAFYSYAHVPWVKPGQRHFTEADIPQGMAKFQLYEMGKEMMLAAGYQEIGMDHFALADEALYQSKLAGQLHRNFMGYTPTHTQILIGLGVSSISDCFSGYAQNEKKVEDYLKRVENAEFPIIKGHLCTPEDQAVRAQILALMCQEELDLNPDQLAEIEGRLSSLIADDLVEIKGYKLIVKPQGKSFLRNICMAFDAKLWEKEPETVLFSSAI